MKLLDKQFTSLTWNFKQVCREKEYAIYERKKEDDTFIHYEVIKVLKHNGLIMHGNKIPPSEYYPSSNQWGIYGFTCRTRQAAYARLDRMMKEEQSNKLKKSKK